MDNFKNYSLTALGFVILACTFLQVGCAPSPVQHIRDVDNPAIQPVQFKGFFRIYSGNLANGSTYFFNVPENKRLVIEHIAVRADQVAFNDSLDVSVSTTVNGVLVEHFLGLLAPQNRPKIDPHSGPYQFLSKCVRIYADPGTPVSVGGSRLTRNPETIVIFAMSGYFVDIP